MTFKPVFRAVILVGASIGSGLGAGAAERPQSRAREISGQVSVYDGDRIDLDGRRMRLAGIDAPEPRQTCADAQGKLYNCGRVSEVALAQKLVGKTVVCEEIGSPRASSVVAICRLGEEDIGAWLVSEGLAVAERVGEVRYARQEAEASRAKRGLWAGSFTMPWDLRRGVRGMPDGHAIPVAAPLAAEPQADIAGKAAAGRDGCRIKGNITREGTKLYWIPGSRRYDETVITERSGERWFCTEDEAKAAGWQEPEALAEATAKEISNKEASGKEGCRIKGNITREGTKLYWVPGSRRYAETVITERSGERWFCSEDEARAAGWQEPEKEAPRD